MKLIGAEVDVIGYQVTPVADLLVEFIDEIQAGALLLIDVTLITVSITRAARCDTELERDMRLVAILVVEVWINLGVNGSR